MILAQNPAFRYRVWVLCYDRRSAGQSVLEQSAHLGLTTRSLLHVWQLRSCSCGAPSLTRGRVCPLYMLLALDSEVFLGSESLGTWDHILLSQIWDFPFRRLLRLAGSRWRYSAPPPHGEGNVLPPSSGFKRNGLHGLTSQKAGLFNLIFSCRLCSVLTAFEPNRARPVLLVAAVANLSRRVHIQGFCYEC
jgi:hypothetical protein